ncbi:MAG: malonyl-CoA decarboxylase family protein [Acidobacteriota bacterium]|nr:malonyl-CoA decarboxylase family protein [Acidobacteriota bacterium]
MGFLTNLLRAMQSRRGGDMQFLCHRLLSERGEASQTAVAQEIINSYRAMGPAQRPSFFEMLCREFSPDAAGILRASAEYQKNPGTKTLAALSAAVEAPRQELIRRINTAPGGTETLVALRGDLLDVSRNGNAGAFEPLDADLRHLFRSWFNRGFLRLERISWQTSALILEKLIRYESVHEINGWADLRRRLEADRRCFAFFHPALASEPIIFVEVALSSGILGELEPLLDPHAPVSDPSRADTAIFYSINNCLKGLRNVPFGNFLIKQVVAELAAEFPNIKIYSTLSPMPRFAQALADTEDKDGITHERLVRLLEDFAPSLTSATGKRDPAEAFLRLLGRSRERLPSGALRRALVAPLERVALAYLTHARLPAGAGKAGKLYDPVATFHLSNGARIERINAFGNLRPYGIEESFGVTVNYRYVPDDLEENHERFVRGQIEVSRGLHRELEAVSAAWQ